MQCECYTENHSRELLYAIVNTCLLVYKEKDYWDTYLYIHYSYLQNPVLDVLKYILKLGNSDKRHKFHIG
jgi:hypothetical protein